MRKIKSVSFSLNEPFESKLFEHVLNQGPFSKYVKRLIQRDLEGVTYQVEVEQDFESDFNSFI